MPPKKSKAGKSSDASAPAAEASRSGTGHAPDFSNQGLLIEFVQTNPKRRGTAAYERYDKYKHAKTVREALAAGAIQGDFKNDHSKSYLRVADGSAPSTSDAQSKLFTASRAVKKPAPDDHLSASQAPAKVARRAPASPARGPQRKVCDAECVSASSAALPAAKAPAVVSASQASAALLKQQAAEFVPAIPTMRQTLWQRIEARKSSVPPPLSTAATASSSSSSSSGPAQDIAAAAQASFAIALQPFFKASRPPETGLGGRAATAAAVGAFAAAAPAAAAPETAAPATAAPATLAAAPVACAAAAAAAEEVGHSPVMPPLVEASLVAGLHMCSSADLAASGPALPSGTGDASDDCQGIAYEQASAAAVENAFGSSQGVTGALLQMGDLTPTEPDANADAMSDEELLRAATQAEVAAREQQKDAAVAVVENEPPAPSLEDAQHADPLALDEASGSGEEITLRLRLGIVVIKQEPQDPLPSTGVEPQVEGAQARQAMLPAAPSSAPVTTARGDLHQFFKRSGGNEEKAAEEQQQALEQQRQERERLAAEQFEEAQIASYDLNVAERRERAARERDAIGQGDLRPLDGLDEELMSAIYCGELMMEWLAEAANRLLLFHYLQVRAKAVSWYAEPAKAYFAEQRQHLDGLLEQEDVSFLMTEYIRDETEKVERALFEMPEKGSFLPRLFDKYRDHSLSGGNATENSQGCVELD
eukprot:TRINITY_DN18214_c0_g1_i1.p1 TRINITY_DN18214_c0_g1~~TRINITY_DN18214_c0_g1_i1.p1  ORF type:complete len:708 (+),score=189.41 TRINITY_DN18214_c0_g1_i1:88-2211(+)